MTHLLDTGWIIRHLRGSAPHTATLLKFGSSSLGIAVVSLAELFEGVYRASDPVAAQAALLTFCHDKSLLAVTTRTCKLFGQHRLVYAPPTSSSATWTCSLPAPASSMT